MNNSDQLIIWEFIRGDLPVEDFEKYVYSAHFENIIESDFYLEIIWTNFKNKRKVFELKKQLRDFLRLKFPIYCECVSLPNFALVGQGSEEWFRIISSLDEIKNSKSRWWLRLSRCRKCGQNWLVAEDSSYDDDIFKRLDEAAVDEIIRLDEWPSDFKMVEDFRLGGYMAGDSKIVKVESRLFVKKRKPSDQLQIG